MFNISRISLISKTLLFSFVATSAWAAHVVNSNSTQAIIEFDSSDTQMQVGARFLAIEGQKSKGLLEIIQISGMKAKAKILNGSAPISSSLRMAPKGTTNPAVARKRSLFGRNTMVAGIAGYSIDSQTVKATNTSGSVTETVATTGSGFSLKGMGDIPLSGNLGLVGRFGFETFNTSGNSQNSLCVGNTSACTTSLTYIIGDLLMRYAFSSGDFMPFVLGGLGIHYPMSKSSNILDESKISATTVFYFGGGAYLKLTDRFFVPVTAEYALFPPSNEVSTNYIALRAGFGAFF